jgi:hypothetical protein
LLGHRLAVLAIKGEYAMLDDYIKEKESTLIGFVYEIEENGIVRGIAISTGDEDYIVEMNEWGKQLCKEIENDVKVTGFVSKDQDGKLHIRLTGYELLYKDGEYNIIHNLDEDNDF